MYSIFTLLFSIPPGIIYYTIRRKYNDFKKYKIENLNEIENGKYFFENMTLESTDMKNIYLHNLMLENGKLLERLECVLNENIICKIKKKKYNIYITDKYLFNQIANKENRFIKSKYLVTEINRSYYGEIYKYETKYYFMTVYIVPHKIRCNFIGNVSNNEITIETFFKNDYHQELNNYKNDKEIFKKIFISSLLLSSCFMILDFSKINK